MFAIFFFAAFYEERENLINLLKQAGLIALILNVTMMIIAYYLGKHHGRLELTEKVVNSMLKTLEQGGFIKTKLDKNGEVELIKRDEV